MTADARPDAEEAVTTIKVVDNGPLQVKGVHRIVDHEGAAYDTGARRTAFLCRCGHSASKPFCDGTHAKIGFDAAGRADATAADEE